VWDRGRKHSLGNVIDAGFNNKGDIVCSDSNRKLLLQSKELKKLPFVFLGDAADVNNLINDRGIVVGNTGSVFAPHEQVAIWNRGHLVDIPITDVEKIKNHLWSTNAVAVAINNKDQLLLQGFNDPALSQGTDCLWSHGQLTNIGTIFNSKTVHGVGLNDRGWVVGNAYNAPSIGYGFIATDICDHCLRRMGFQ